MGFVVNESKGGGRQRKLYTGITNCIVQAINPSAAELEELLGITSEKEPVYTGTNDEGVKWVRIDVYIKPSAVEIEDAFAKMAFFITEEEFIGSKTGKKQFINLYGRCAWATSKDAIDEETQYFDNVDPRPAFKGEEDLHKWLIAWLNPKSANSKKGIKADPCRLEKPENLFKEDFSELKQLVTIAEENEFRPLWGVRAVTKDDGNIAHYQDVFTGKFDRAYSRTVQYDAWNKALGLGGEYPWKSDYQNVLDKFQEYRNGQDGQSDNPNEGQGNDEGKPKDKDVW